MRSHSSPFADLKSAAQQQAATTAGRPSPFAAVPAEPPTGSLGADSPQIAESAPQADSAPKKAESAPPTDSPRRRTGRSVNAGRGAGAGSAASELAALRAQPRQQTVDVNGFRVAVPAGELGRVVATTVQVPYELREAVREAERLTGRSYQDLARLGLRLVLEQLSGHQAPESAPNH